MSAGAITADMAHISYRYGAITALDDVSLRFAQGDMVGLIGPDGVGKSTLLGLMAGTRWIQQGRVEVPGDEMADPTHRAARYPRIAYMPQGLGPNLCPTLSVHENVDFFAPVFGQGPSERKDLIWELLESTGLAPFAARPADKLSGGVTPLEAMPEPLRSLMRLSPATHFTGFAQAVLYRGAGFSLVWKDLLAVICIGAVFLGLALSRFRKTMAAAR